MLEPGTPIKVQTFCPVTIKGIFIAIAVFCVFQMMPTTALAAKEIGTAVKVVNQVRAKTLNRKLKLGDKVVYQETVSTGKKSAVDIRLIDESTLLMGELPEMILDSLVYNPNRGVVEGVLEIANGILRFLSAGVKLDLTINTPTITIGVRGTEFDVLSHQDATEVAVREGVIEVTSALGTQSVSRGQIYRVTAAGTGGFEAEPTPELKEAVSLMLTLVADSDSAGAAQNAGKEQAALRPAASDPFKNAVKGKNKQNLLYMDLSKGRLVIELRPDLAPQHVLRLKQLARQGFYDGLGFHFVRRGYVAETGDPTGTGIGGSGQTLPAEFSDEPFERGVVGMSRKRDEKDSADSQFFITLGRVAALDGKYTVIGKVIHGIELADQLQTGRPPKTPDTIVRFRVGADVRD